MKVNIKTMLGDEVVSTREFNACEEETINITMGDYHATIDFAESEERWPSKSVDCGENYHHEHIGLISNEPTLTKREQFAMAAMQGLIVAYPCNESTGIIHHAQVARKFSDALIKELDK